MNIQCFFFESDNTAENNIFQVYEKELSKKKKGQGRIGWIFPIQALLSKEHDYNQNEFFLRYAYVAFRKLITNNSDFYGPFPRYEYNKIYSIGDFYYHDTIILLLSNKCTSEIENFQIDNYLPSLYKNGYYYSNGKSRDNSYEYLYRNSKNINSSDNNDNKKRLNIEPISKYLNDGNYINKLFNNLLRNEKHYLVKFHLLYQVIELLIEKIFNNEVKKLFEILQVGSCDLYEIRNEFSKLSEELGRIEKLFSEYSKNIDDIDAFKSSCIKLLEKLRDGKNIKSYSSGKALYLVRNLLVHSYRKVTNEYTEILEDINYYFERVIIDIIINYEEV